MRQFHDTELQQSETVAELINEPVSVGKQNGIGNNNVGRIAVLAVVAIGILVIPIAPCSQAEGIYCRSCRFSSGRALAP